MFKTRFGSQGVILKEINEKILLALRPPPPLMAKVMNYLLFPLVWCDCYLKNDIGDKGNQVKRLVLSPIKLCHDHKQVGPREHGAVKSFVQVKLSEDYIVSHHSAIFLCALRTEFSMSMGWYLIPRRINVSSRAPTTKTASWCSAMQKGQTYRVVFFTVPP